jgi:hypothetical protein
MAFSVTDADCEQGSGVACTGPANHKVWSLLFAGVCREHCCCQSSVRGHTRLCQPGTRRDEQKFTFAIMVKR